MKLLNFWQHLPIHHALQRFFENRIAKSDDVRLGLKNVYVFFSRQGALFGVLLVLLFVLGVNYANNMVLGLLFYLFGIWLVGVFYAFVQIASLSVRLVDIETVPAQSICWVSIEIKVHGGQPSRQVQVYFDDHYAQQAGDNRTTLVSLSGTTLIKLPVFAPKRGTLTLPRLVLSSVYPLGVVRAWSYVYFVRTGVVYPKPLAFEWQSQSLSSMADDTAVGHVGTAGQSEFNKLDTYREGESLSRVSWAHLARGGGMLTKHFFDPQGGEQVLDYAQMPALSHEDKLSQLAYAITSLQSLGQSFALILPSGQGQLGEGDEFAHQCFVRLSKEP